MDQRKRSPNDGCPTGSHRQTMDREQTPTPPPNLIEELEDGCDVWWQLWQDTGGEG